MLVEFNTIQTDPKETYDKEIQIEIRGKKSDDFFYEEDYVSKTVINLDNIVGFKGRTIYFNDQKIEVVFCLSDDGFWSENLYISYEDFKKIYELYKKQKIPSFISLLEKEKETDL